jgi:hypothetical protein
VLATEDIRDEEAVKLERVILELRDEIEVFEAELLAAVAGDNRDLKVEALIAELT